MWGITFGHFQEDFMLTNSERREQLTQLNAQAELGGGVERINKQHEQGKYSAR
jgi:hypothetical protein